MANKQVLETIISIGAQVGNGFSAVGATLTELGSMVNGLSQDLIQFGEDSINVYRDYEKSMADASVALSTTYGKSTKELSSVMSQLDKYATEWAATTIFHTDDVSHAISEAAHAGWDFEQIISGIPAAMQLAQAGSIDLSEAVDYIVKSTNAMGIEFDDVGDFIDQWAFAANSSASTIDEFGSAMLRMGSTMRFAGSTEELMTLIAVTANAGSVGSEAGTMIRNSIMRLIAPTQKADKAMAELGATSEETAELLNDEALQAANAALEAQGFSAFDQEGNLKPILDIYRELYVALGEIAGGYEDLNKNEAALSILSAIFPTRTITEALNLLNAAANGYDGLYDAMKEGAAEGYGAYAADVMMDTLNGHIEIFNSKVERLKQVTGERLSDQLSDFLGSAGQFVDDIANLDNGKFNALVSGLEVLAAAGPAFIAGGTGLRIIGRLLGPAGAIGMGTIVLGALVAAMSELDRANFADNFGDMAVDVETIHRYAQSLSGDFLAAYEPVNHWKSALEESVATFQAASSELSSDLFTAMITKATLTDADKENMYRLADEMTAALMDGIANRTAADMEFWSAFFGADNQDLYSQIISITEGTYNSSLSEAEKISQEFREALTAAFDDGTITADEQKELLEFFKNYNEAMAKAAADAENEQNQIDLRKKYLKGQSPSWETTQGAYFELKNTWDETLNQYEDDYYDAYARAEMAYDEAIANGAVDYAGNPITEYSKESALKAIEEENRRKQYEYTKESIINPAFDMLDYVYSTNDISAAYEYLQGLAEQVLSGSKSRAEASFEFKSLFGNNKTVGDAFAGGSVRTQLSEQLAYFIDALGGVTNLSDMITSAFSEGDPELAQRMMLAFAMQQINDEGYITSIGNVEDMGPVTGFLTRLFEGEHPIVSIGTDGSFYENILAEYNNARNEVLNNPVPMNVLPFVDGMNPIDELTAQGFQIDVSGDTQQLQGVIDAEDGQTLMQYVDGDTDDLHMKIQDQDGQTLVENVTGDATELAAIINRFRGQVIRLNITGTRMFAEGGRATTASVFGEAGPEWAIPEEHSERTAALLNAARLASGFTWGDILGRFGGLNANANNMPGTLIYSPTINANDARGVEEALMNDKKRLDKWYQDRVLKDKLEVYS